MDDLANVTDGHFSHVEVAGTHRQHQVRGSLLNKLQATKERVPAIEDRLTLGEHGMRGSSGTAIGTPDDRCRDLAVRPELSTVEHGRRDSVCRFRGIQRLRTL